MEGDGQGYPRRRRDMMMMMIYIYIYIYIFFHSVSKIWLSTNAGYLEYESLHHHLEKILTRGNVCISLMLEINGSFLRSRRIMSRI